MTTVLGLDVALDWQSIGSALLAFDSATLLELRAPAIDWPRADLTAATLADVVDDFARRRGVVAIAIDGPQGWRDPETPPGLPGVGRRCEFEARTPAKTGVPGHTYPSTQRRWIQFSIDLFDALLKKPHVRLGEPHSSTSRPDGYVILECFPTSVWRAAGLAPLPAKGRRPDVEAHAKRLLAAFGVTSVEPRISGHDDLQALAAAWVAAAYAGGPAVPRALGAPAAEAPSEWGGVRVEGFIWEASPRDPPGQHVELAGAGACPPPADGIGRVLVSPDVVDQVARSGRSHAQIALAGLPSGTALERRHVHVLLEGEVYPLAVGDSHAAWARHQTDAAAEGFERLFARLADSPGTSLAVDWRHASEPAVGPPSGGSLATHGPPIPDAMDRTVAIPIRVDNGAIVELGGGSFPVLQDCVGELIVPAFALANAKDRERFTSSATRELFQAGTPLLCRVSGQQVPAELLPMCRVESVPDSTTPGAFVEIVLKDPLRLITRGTKRAVLAGVTCIVPALGGVEAKSLNEAYRRISERFEPRRRSVGGNVFRSVYYFEPTKASWRPIGELRGDILFPPR